MKVAIVHDWITSFAGATRVAYELHNMFPDAPIYTSVYDQEAVPEFADATVITSFLQNIPILRSKHQLVPLLRQKAFEKFDLSDFDLVISSSGSEAKGVITNGKTIHINYCHSPTHYYWHNYEDYLKNPGFGVLDPIARIGLKAMVGSARKWDYKAAQRPDHMIANSVFIKEQIKKYYDRESNVVHPPVSTENFKTSRTIKRNGFLIFGRQVPFKKMHLAVQACTRLGLDLTVAGGGPENAYLRSIAGPTVTFETDVSDKRKVELFAVAEAFIMCNEEDFGIVMVESMAAGTPVVAYRSGGALDIVDKKTGVFFDEQTPESLADALSASRKISWDQKLIKTHAKNFNVEVFTKKITQEIKKITK